MNPRLNEIKASITEVLAGRYAALRYLLLFALTVGILSSEPPQDLVRQDTRNQEANMPTLVPQIASIMRNYGQTTGNAEWEKAAKLQDLWLGFAKHVSTPIAPERFDYSVVAWPTQTGITMDWLLNNSVSADGRAQSVFMQLQALVTSDPDGQMKAAIRDQLTRLFAATASNSVQIGSIKWSPGVDLKAFHSQRVYANPAVTDPLTTPLDPLYGTLGSFNFYAIPVGRAQMRADGSAQVQIDDFVFYVIDSFDFEGPQLLGFFAPPDKISKNPFDGGSLMTNGAYQDYRDSPAAGGKGGDFLVATDTRTVHLPQNFSVAPDPTVNGTWISPDAKHRFALAINGDSVEWTETGPDTGIVVKKTLGMVRQGNMWRIERPNTDPAVLTMLGFQNAALQQAILNHSPHPSFLLFKLENSQLVAKWSGIRVKKTPQGAFQSLVQPDDPANPASDYSLARLIQ